MVEREQRLLRALAWMAIQYLEGDDGTIWSGFHQAGESTLRSLAEYELLKEVNGRFEWTELGYQTLGARPKGPVPNS
jgi:hypothetical protein